MKFLVKYLVFSSILFGACFTMSEPLEAYTGEVNHLSNASEMQNHGSDSHDHEGESETCHDKMGAEDFVLRSSSNTQLFVELIALANFSHREISYYKSDTPFLVTNNDPPDHLIEEIKTIRLLS